MSSPSILVGTPTLIKNNDGSLSCSFTANFITLPASLGGPGYRLIAYLSCRNGTIQLNCINNITNQSVAYTRSFGMIQGQQELWTTTQDPPDTTLLNGNVSLVSPTICDAGNTTQIESVTYTTVELALQQNRVHNAVRHQVEHFLWQTVQVP